MGVNPPALLDLAAFWQSVIVAQLDPAAPDFQTKLTATITEMVEANPFIAATPAEAPQVAAVPEGQLDTAQLATMSPAETAKAYAEGRLRHLLTARPEGPADTPPAGQLGEGGLAGQRPQDIARAYAEGRLNHLLGRPVPPVAT